MTWVDAIPIVLVIGYGVLGYFTGVLRRLIGLVALYVAFVASTNMGLSAGSILQQTSSVAVADSRIYGFFGIVFVVLLIIDGAAQLVHTQIQIEAILFNRISGVVIGVLTAILLSVLVTYELVAAGNPSGGGQLDAMQQNIRDGVNGSHVAVPLTNAIGKPIVAIFDLVLPPDPHNFFSNLPVTPKPMSGELFERLRKRAVEIHVEDHLRARLERRESLRVKLGLDPTAPDLHVGHLVVLHVLRTFQDAGHTVVLIVGDFTAMIGDPSGRSETRPILTREQVDAAAGTYLDQIHMVLDRDRLEVRRNSEWLGEMKGADVLRLLGKAT